MPPARFDDRVSPPDSPLQPFPASAGCWVLACVLMAGAGTASSQTTSPSSASERIYDVPAGPLEDALNAFARQAGLTLSFAPALVEGIEAAGLHGVYSVLAGLDALLANTDLIALAASDGTFSLMKRPSQRQEAAQLMPPVRVEEQLDDRMQPYDEPGSSAVITREQIERQPPRNTSDVLVNVAGVFTSQPRTDPGVSVNIRGIQDFGRVNVMLDGVRQNFQKSGHGANGQVYLDPALLSGVDVSKGVSSTSGGAGTIAGIVNFRTLEAADLIDSGEDSGARVVLSSGDNAYHFAGNTAYAQRFGERFEAVAALSHKDVGEFRLGRRDSQNLGGASFVSLDTGQDQWSGLLKARWFPSDDLAIGVSYVGLAADFGYTQSNNYTAYDVRSDTFKADLRWSPENQRWIDLDASLYYTLTSRDEWRSFASETNQSAEFNAYYETNTVGGTLENRLLADWGQWQARWSTGGEFFFDWTDPHAAGSDEATRVGQFDPAWYAGSTPEGERLLGSLFTELTLGYRDWLQVSSGLRYDWYCIDGSGEFYVGSVANPPGVRPPVTRINTRFEIDRNKGFLAPHLQVAVKPWRFLQLFTSYGLAFRPPAITETLFSGGHVNNMWANYPGVNLLPEEAASFEIGFNITADGLLLPQDQLGVKLAWFDTRIDNYIVNAKVMAPNDLVSGGLFADAGFVNLLNEVAFDGYELSADYAAGVLFGQLAYTRVNADLGAKRYDPFPLGSRVGYPPTELGQGSNDLSDLFYTGPPDLKLALSAGLRGFGDRVELGYRFRYEEQNTSSDWMSTNQAYLRLHDLWAAWKPQPWLTLRLSVDNLLDVTYLEMFGSGGGSYGPGRTVLGTVALKF